MPSVLHPPDALHSRSLAEVSTAAAAAATVVASKSEDAREQDCPVRADGTSMHIPDGMDSTVQGIINIALNNTAKHKEVRGISMHW